MAEPSAVKRERIPLATKLIYASPAFAGSALALPIFVFMPKFYSDDVGAPLGFIAFAIAFARSFDAITDPMMGWISDRTKTRWGRRRPWLAVGAPLAAVAAFALFSPPNDLTTVTAAWWFLGAFSLYFLFHTIYEIPYLALGSELSMDYHERSSLFGWRTAIALVGQTVAGAGLFLFGSDDPAANRVAFTGMGMFYAGLLVAFYALLIARVLPDPAGAQARSARWLLAATFVFAAAWKLLLSDDFLDGRFFRVTLLTDPRFEGPARWLGGMTPEGLDASRTFLFQSRVHSALTVPPLVEPPALRQAALALTWISAAAESLVAALFVAPVSGIARHVALLAFCAGTYAFAPVEGFGWLLLALGVAAAPVDAARVRTAYVACFALLVLYAGIHW